MLDEAAKSGEQFFMMVAPGRFLQNIDFCVRTYIHQSLPIRNWKEV
jgi:hypothetical protein